jgi:hypothetical protein
MSEPLQRIAKALAAHGQRELATEAADISLQLKAAAGKPATSPFRTAGVQTRSLNEIAMEIWDDWKPVNYAAKPYLDAMGSLDKITDSYINDPGSSIVAYFLSNARSWKGPKAKAIKDELKKMLR